MLKVIQVVNSILSSNTYIVYDEGFKDCWLVDIGDFDRIVEALPKGKSIRGLLLTHSHFDHIYGINDLCVSFPECVVYVSKYDSFALKDDKKNLSRYYEYPIIYEGNHIEVVGEGDVIPFVGNTKINVAATPGHGPGCLTFYTGRYIFTGDSYIPDVKVVTNLPGGNRTEADVSFERIHRLAKGKIICPGHGTIKS